MKILPCANFAAVILLLQDYAAEAPPPQNEAGPDDPTHHRP